MDSACERGAVVGEPRSTSNGGVGGSALTIIAASEAASTPSDGVEDGVEDGVAETEEMPAVTASRGRKHSSAKSAAGRRKDHDATPHRGTKRKKQEHGKFHLESPDFEIPDFGGGVRRRRYPAKFKLDAVAYSEKIVEGGRGPGGSIGVSYATKRLGIRDCSSIVRWKQDRRNLEAELLSVEAKTRVVTNRKKKEGKVSSRKRPRAAHVKDALSLGRPRTQGRARETGSTQSAQVEIKAFYARKIDHEKVRYTFKQADTNDIDAYHAALFKFIIRCWTQFHNETAKKTGDEFMSEKEMLEVASNDDVPMVMTVQEESGDMVKFNTEAEFVAALANYSSWKHCLHVETYKFKRAPTRASGAPLSDGELLH